MPKIPTVERRSFGQTNMSVGDQSKAITAVEMRQAQGLESFAQGVSKLGQGIGQYQEKKKNLDKSNWLADAKVRAAEAVQMVPEFVDGDAQLLPDGSNRVELANDLYKENMNAFLETMPEEYRPEADVLWRKAFLPRRAKMLAQREADFVKFTAKKTDEIMDTFSTLLTNDASPEALASAFETSTKQYNDQSKNLFMSEEQEADVREKTHKGFANTAVNTLIRQKKFGEARERITKGDLSGIYKFNNGVNEKETMLALVDSGEVKAKSLEIQRMNFADRLLNKDKKIISERVNSNLSKLVFDDTKGVDDKMKAVETAKENNSISSTEFNFHMSNIKKEIVSNDEEATFYYFKKMQNPNQNLVQLKQDVMNSSGRSISAPKAMSLVNAIDRKMSASAQSPTNKSKARTAKMYLDGAFLSPDFLSKLEGDKELKMKRAKVEEDYGILVNEKGMDEVEAAKEVIRVNGGFDSAGSMKPKSIADKDKHNEEAIQKEYLKAMTNLKAMDPRDERYKSAKRKATGLMMYLKSVKGLNRMMNSSNIVNEIKNKDEK